MTISIRPFMPDAPTVFMSPSSSALKGCLVFHSGCCGASFLTRSNAKRTCVYIGYSTHKVPSLSKIAFFVGPSFHDWRASCATALLEANHINSNDKRRYRCIRMLPFILFSFFVISIEQSQGRFCAAVSLNVRVKETGTLLRVPG